jgi:nicotinic acid mononucleotide adenylyltransferase
MAAFQRARRFQGQDIPLYGIGCTAALATERARRGSDRCYVAVQSIDETIEYSLDLSRARRNRASQEGACSDLIIDCIASALSLEREPMALLEDESLSSITGTAMPGWKDLFSGHLTYTNHEVADPRLVFPGAFNPLHDGHRRMAAIARDITGKPVLLEISTFNVDKPPLDYLEMHAREDGLRGDLPFTFTNAATFAEKSALFPGATFIVGSDTLERIAAPRYYHDSHELRDKTIDVITGLNVTFLVFGRIANDQFKGLDEIDIPVPLRRISRGIPEQQFRMDVSSTHIRRLQ